MQFYILPDAEVDESFELVATPQGILRMPQKRPHKNQDGTLDYWVGRWHVPDYPKWSSIPGFPEFLFDSTRLTPGLVRPLTTEERRDYFARGKAEEVAPEVTPCLTFLAGSSCVRVGGKVVRLSKRGYELLRRTVESNALPHEAAIEALQAVPTESPGGSKFVEFDALRDYRRAILDKVREEAGVPFATLLEAAFRSENRVFVYDEAILPSRTE